MNYGYVRTSILDCDNHYRQLCPLARLNCDEIVEEIGDCAPKHRPALEALLARAKRGDIISVWGFERIACSITDLRKTIKRLTDAGIVLHAVKERFWSADPRSLDTASLLDHLANLDRFLNREKVASSARTRVARQGKRGSANRKLSDHDLEQIVELLRGGIRKADIAARFGVSLTNLYLRLREEKYRHKVPLRLRSEDRSHTRGPLQIE